MTKHLDVLERAGIVGRRHAGRRSLYTYRPQPVDASVVYLERVTEQWNGALSRLKSRVER